MSIICITSIGKQDEKMVRSVEEISAEIEMIKAELKATPKDNPNVGHLLTILIGLEGELNGKLRKGEITADRKSKIIPKM